MIVESGVVTRVCGGHVWVASNSQQDCQRCAQGIGCGGALMSKLLGSRLHEIRAVALGSLAVGQGVDLKLSETALLMAALMTYVIPLMGLMSGALIGFWVSSTGDGGTLIGACIGFVSSLLLLRGMNGVLSSDYQPVAARRFEQDR